MPLTSNHPTHTTMLLPSHSLLFPSTSLIIHGEGSSNQVAFSDLPSPNLGDSVPAFSAYMV